MKKQKKKRRITTVFAQAKKTVTPFTESLNALTAAQIPLRRSSVERKSTSGIIMSAVRYAVLTLSSLVFIASCTALLMYTADSIKAANDRDFYQSVFRGDGVDFVSVDKASYQNAQTLSIQSSLDGETLGDTSVNIGTSDPLLEEMRSKILTLKRINPDVWGWISVDDTGIDFPIMFSGDNEYYLDRTPTNETNRNGSIFADGRTESSLEDNRNLIVYGHNMSTANIMFSELIDFTREDIFNTRGITVYTTEGIYRYEMFAIYSTTADYDYIRTYFASDAHFLQFVNTCDFMSMYHKGFSFNANDKILTLSTCTNQRDNKRWAMHCKLMSITK